MSAGDVVASWGVPARRRVGAIVSKELRDYRRNRFVVLTMTLFPLIFIVAPAIQLFSAPAVAASTKLTDHVGLSLFYLLLAPAVIPSTLSAYSVVGEREQGTLEPVLTTPISTAELLVGKAVAVLLPTLAIAYGMFGVFCALTALLAKPVIASAVFTSSHLLVQLLFMPLLSGWSIWIGIAISTRSLDVRTAQQLAVFASLPPLAVVSLMALNVIKPSLGLALGLAAALLVMDALGWRAVAAMFDRERLVTGTKA